MKIQIQNVGFTSLDAAQWLSGAALAALVASVLAALAAQAAHNAAIKSGA